MANNKQTPNQKAWDSAVTRFKRRVKYWAKKLLNVKYELTKPDRISKSDIKDVDEITYRRIKSKGTITTRTGSVSVIDNAKERAKEMFPDWEKSEKEYQKEQKRERKRRENEQAAKNYEEEWEEIYYNKEEIVPDPEDIVEPEPPKSGKKNKKTNKPKQLSKKQLLQQIAERVKAEREGEVTDEELSAQAIEISNNILKADREGWYDKVGRRGTKLIRDLLELGMTPDQIEYRITNGERLPDIKEDWIQSNEEVKYAETEYYISTETGKVYGVDDPRIYAKNKKGRREVDIKTGKLKIREDLQYHIGDEMTSEKFKEIKWSNFIGSFELAHPSHFVSINPTGIFNTIKDEVGVDAFMDAMTQLSSEGSNIGELTYWYSEGALQNIEKLEALLSRVEKNTGKELTNLRKEIATYRELYADSSGWTVAPDERVRQQNRLLHQR